MFEFDFSAFDGIVWGVTGKYDMHNIAQESARIRGEITELKKSIAEISDSIRKWRQPLQP